MYTFPKIMYLLGHPPTSSTLPGIMTSDYKKKGNLKFCHLKRGIGILIPTKKNLLLEQLIKKNLLNNILTHKYRLISKRYSSQNTQNQSENFTANP